MGTVLAVCTSAEKGVQKRDVHSAHFTPEWGIDGDAHAGKWHRQVSLLSLEKSEPFHQDAGAFGENLLVTGFDLSKLPIGTQLRCGEGLLEITQIGKECHSQCEIYKRTGDCIMPREGVFAVVKAGGWIRVGDDVEIVQ